jgi:hypothetical protein
VVNPPGSEFGQGQGAATYGIASTDQADAFGLSWARSGRLSKHIPFEWFGVPAAIAIKIAAVSA